MDRQRTLKRFTKRVFAGLIGIVSAASGLYAFKDVASTPVLIFVGVVILGLIGWAAAGYLAYKPPGSPTERLISSISTVIDVPFTETWLKGTLLDQRSIDLYRKMNRKLRLEEITIHSTLHQTDIENIITFKGRNDSGTPADNCPMLLLGGSVVHYRELYDNHAWLIQNMTRVSLAMRSKLDLGTLHLIEMLFPAMLSDAEPFVIEHRHIWPAAMTRGLDVMWYPYVAMFNKEVTRLKISISFELPATYVRAFIARLDEGTCEPSSIQPVDVSGNRLSFNWEIFGPDADSIYFMVFDRS